MTLFPITRTSTVLVSRATNAQRRARSRDAIVRAYWQPVFQYIASVGRCDRQRADDLTQSF